MDSITLTRPNHYEVLGLKPSASDEEIGRAFASRMSPLRPHGLGDIAAASVAYEALRDPLRRRAYDVSIGLRPEKDPVPRTPEGWRFVGSMHVGPAAPAPRIERQAQPELRPVAQTPERAAIVPHRVLPAIEERPVEWKRPAVVVAGMFAGVALIGAAAGLWAARDVQPKAAEQAVTIGIPKAEARPVTTTDQGAEPGAVAPAVANARPERRVEARRLVPKAKAREAASPPVIVGAEDQALGSQAEALRADQAPEISTEQVEAQTAAASAETSSLPLSNATIARTLGRIGYSCGTVASTGAVGGGAFKVNCTSGQSYKAAPVRGRIHFRKWSGR